MDERKGYRCNKINGASNCLSGLDSFGLGGSVPSYVCTSCDFDLCHACMKADLAIELCAKRKTKIVEKKAPKPKSANSIDLKKIYSETSKFGFSIETVPDLKYIVNEKLLDITKEQYNEFIGLVKKFPAACDKEFLYEMNKSLKTVTKNLKDINTDTDFKISEMKFTDKRL